MSTFKTAITKALNTFDHTVTEWHEQNSAQSYTNRGRILSKMIGVLDLEYKKIDQQLSNQLNTLKTKNENFTGTEIDDNSIANTTALIDRFDNDLHNTEQALSDLKDIYKDITGFDYQKPMGYDEWLKQNQQKKQTASNVEAEARLNNPKYAKYFA